jgi:hypothetical protein
MRATALGGHIYALNTGNARRQASAHVKRVSSVRVDRLLHSYFSGRYQRSLTVPNWAGRTTGERVDRALDQDRVFGRGPVEKAGKQIDKAVDEVKR